MDDMRRLVAVWPPPTDEADVSAFVMKTLGKPSLSRARDTFVRAFRPRFMAGDPVEAWKMAQVLEKAEIKPNTAKVFYYWITARSEAVLYQFVTDELMQIQGKPDPQVTVEETMNWLSNRLQEEGKKWTSTVTRKVARGLLACLRDFGILQGTSRKTFAPFHCPLDGFALISFALHDLGFSGQNLLEHPDWRLFLFSERDVERAFLECDQRGWLTFQAAGAISRVDFPFSSFKEYARVVVD